MRGAKATQVFVYKNFLGVVNNVQPVSHVQGTALNKKIEVPHLAVDFEYGVTHSCDR